MLSWDMRDEEKVRGRESSKPKKCSRILLPKFGNLSLINQSKVDWPWGSSHVTRMLSLTHITRTARLELYSPQQEAILDFENLRASCSERDEGERRQGLTFVVSKMHTHHLASCGRSESACETHQANPWAVMSTCTSLNRIRRHKTIVVSTDQTTCEPNFSRVVIVRPSQNTQSLYLWCPQHRPLATQHLAEATFLTHHPWSGPSKDAHRLAGVEGAAPATLLANFS